MKKLFEACSELPCDLSKVRALLESKPYTSTELMRTALEFWKLTEFMNSYEFEEENGREPLQGELPVHYLYDLLKLFLEFGLDPNEIVDEENILYSLCYLYTMEAPQCMRLLLENGGDPNLMNEDQSLCGRLCDRLVFDIEEYYAKIEISFDDMIQNFLVILGYGGCSTDGEELIDMKNGHSVEELRTYEQFSYTIATLPNGHWELRIFRNDSGELAAVF